MIYVGDREIVFRMKVKQIIADLGFIWIPELKLDSGSCSHVNRWSRSARELVIAEIKFEEKLSDNLIPDIIVVNAHSQEMLVALYINHAVDAVKVQRIKDLNIACVEIDLSDVDKDASDETLRRYITGEIQNTKWIHSLAFEHWTEKFYSVAEKFTPVVRSRATYINDCPKKCRGSNGRYYANLMEDCWNCPFLLYYDQLTEGPIMYCTGSAGVVDMDDFELSLPERREKYGLLDIEDSTEIEVDEVSEAEIAEARKELFAPCPRCGAAVVFKRHNIDESLFLGCADFRGHGSDSCKYTRSAKCPSCKAGYLVEYKGSQGRYIGCIRCAYKTSMYY